MKRFGIAEGERFLTDEEVRNTFLEIEGRSMKSSLDPRSKEEYVRVIEYYTSKGENVCCKYFGRLISSRRLEEYKQSGLDSDVLDECTYEYVGPYLSLKELEEEFATLGDFRNPANHPAYLKMMLRTVKMETEGFQIPMQMEGIEGRFKGQYPLQVMNGIRTILRSHLPAEKVFFNEKSGLLNEEFKGEDQEFYKYLGDFCCSPILLTQRESFNDYCEDMGLRYYPSYKMEEVKAITDEANAENDMTL